MDAYAIRLRSRGQLTLPQAVREELQVDDGDFLTLTRINGCIVLTPKSLRISRLSKEFSAMMQQEDVSLADLLEGLAEEREQIWRERQANPSGDVA